MLRGFITILYQHLVETGDPTTANGTIRVVGVPTIAVAAGSNAFPNTVCNLSPMTDINFDVPPFATYTVTWIWVLQDNLAEYHL